MQGSSSLQVKLPVGGVGAVERPLNPYFEKRQSSNAIGGKAAGRSPPYRDVLHRAAFFLHPSRKRLSPAGR